MASLETEALLPLFPNFNQEIILPKVVRDRISGGVEKAYHSPPFNSLLKHRETGIPRHLSSKRTQSEIYSHSYIIRRIDQIAKLRGHEGCVNSLAWDESGSWLVSGSDDRRLLVWKPFENAQKPIYSVKTSHGHNIFAAKFLPTSSCATTNCAIPERIISCASDGSVLLTDMQMFIGNESGFQPNMPFTCHSDMVFDLEPDPLGGGNVFFSCSNDGTVNQYDLRIRSSCVCHICNKHTFIDVNAFPIRFRNSKRVKIDCKSDEGTAGTDFPNAWRYMLGLSGTGDVGVTAVCVNPDNPMHVALGCTDDFVRIYDRRFLTSPVLSMDLEVPLPSSVNSYQGLVYSFSPAALRAKQRLSLFQEPTSPVIRKNVPLLESCADLTRYLGRVDDDSYSYLDDSADYSEIDSQEVDANLIQQMEKEDEDRNENEMYQCPCCQMIYREDGEIMNDDDNEDWETVGDKSSEEEEDEYDSENGEVSESEFLSPEPEWGSNQSSKVTSICYDPNGSGELLVNYAGNNIYRIRPSKFRNCPWNGLTMDEDPVAIIRQFQGDSMKHVRKHFEPPILSNDSPTMLMHFFKLQNAKNYDRDIIEIYSGHSNWETMIKEARYYGTSQQLSATGLSRYIIAGSDDGNIYFWEKGNKKIRQVLPFYKLVGDSHIVNCICPNPSVPYVAVSGIDATIKLFGPCAGGVGYETSSIKTITFSRDQEMAHRRKIEYRRRDLIASIRSNISGEFAMNLIWNLYWKYSGLDLRDLQRLYAFIQKKTNCNSRNDGSPSSRSQMSAESERIFRNLFA